MKNIILVCTHKESEFAQDSIYLPIQLGVDEYDFDLGIAKDNFGINISYKHRFYSEFSGLYCAWKNYEFDYLGICHYRRYFIGKKVTKTEKKPFKRVLTNKEFEYLVEKNPEKIFVSHKRRYFIENLYEHYAHTHNIKDLDLAIEVMKNYFPEYSESFKKVLHKRSAHMFNAFIMPKKYIESYCNFLFSFLFEFEKKVDVSNYNEYEARICGYIGEFLLDVWIEKNNIQYKEIKYRFIGKKRWIKKILNFLNTKFRKSKRAFNYEN